MSSIRKIMEKEMSKSEGTARVVKVPSEMRLDKKSLEGWKER